MVEPPLWTPGQGDDEPDVIDISLNLISQGAEDAINNLASMLERLERLDFNQGSTGTRAGSSYDRQNAGAQPPPRDPRDRPDNASRPQGQPFRVSPMVGDADQGQLFNPDAESQAGARQYDDPQPRHRGSSGPRRDSASRPPDPFEFRTRPGDTRSPYQRAVAADAASRIPTTHLVEADQIEQVTDSASRPPKRMDRALAVASHMAERLHAGSLGGALGIAGNVALLHEVADMGGEEGGGFMSSMMGSVAANTMMGGRTGAAGAPGGADPRLLNMARLAASGMALAHLGGRSFVQPGTALGYDRGMQFNIPGTNIGIQTPFTGWHGILPEIGKDSAFRQELDRRINTFRLRLQGGINGQQASAIMNSLAGEGFSGQSGEDIAFSTVAPLVRQGQDPQLASTMITHAIRNGNSNLEDVRVTLDNLGESARTARMTLNEYQQALDQTAETMQNLGGFRNQSVELTRQLTDSSGLTPQQITPIAQSQLFQAMSFQNSGVMPNAVGAMPGNMFAGNISRTIDFAMRAATPFAHETIDPSTGARISARQNQLIQAAQFTGIPLETFARLQRNSQRLPALANLRGSISGFEQSIQGADRLRAQVGKPDDVSWTHAGMSISGTAADANRKTADRRQQAIDAINSQLTGKNWQPVHNALLSAAPGTPGVHSKDRDSYFRRIADIEKMSDPNERLNATRKLLRDQAQQAVPDDRPSVKLDLTPWAKKLVQQATNETDQAKRNARRGMAPVNADRSKPDQNQSMGVGVWYTPGG